MLALMEEMKTNPAEQPSHHEHQQTEMLDEMLDEMRTSTQRQADQLDRLAKDYGGQMESLVADQK